MKQHIAGMLLLCAAAVHGQQVEISVSPTGGTVSARLDWQSVPGTTYSVHTTPSLLPAQWTNVTPGGLIVSNVLGLFQYPTTNQAQFFQVTKEDTDPPTVTSLIPRDGAIAVASNATVTIGLADETGIDTNSILFSVGPWTDLTLASTGVVWSNSTVTFNPTGALGIAGAMVTNILTVSDTLGHTLSNYIWAFRLARPVVATNAFIPLTAPPGSTVTTLADGTIRFRSLPGVHPLDGTDEYHIVSVTSNTVTFSYASTPPTIENGTVLVSFDAAYPFYRKVLSHTINEVSRQITAQTTHLSLLDLLEIGSISAAVMNGHVEFGGDLSGKVLYEDPGLKIHLPSASWAFGAEVEAAFDVDSWKLQALDTFASGTLTIHVTPEVIFHQAISGSGSVPLVPSATKIIGAMVGPVPVWVEVTMELNGGYEYSADASGNAHTTVDAEKELTFHVHLRNTQWTREVENPSIVLTADPITWRLEGAANVKVHIQPKLTVLVYSLAGLWAGIAPYAELDIPHCLPSPPEYELALYYGLSATLGIESRIPGIPTPEWSYDLAARRLLWSTNYPPQSFAPFFLSSFLNRTVAQGGSITLAGYAKGRPDPAYKWYFNGSRISGATGPEYAISPAQSGHQGTYSVQAWNSAGSVQTSCYLTVSSAAGNYMVVDLSAGPSASSYPVSYMTGVPADGWSDVYKTTKLVLRRIPAGTFIMGAPDGENGRFMGETQHEVTLTQPFYIGVFEVTQRQWERVMGNWPSYFYRSSYRDARPVELVSYYDIRENPANSDDPAVGWPTNSAVNANSFMGKLRAKTGLSALDLPTESQWEYAGRAGTTTALNSGKNLTSVGECPNMAEVGRYLYNGGDSGNRYVDTSEGTAKVGSYLPNAWGLYDIHGNVREWCLDWLGTYPGTVSDPKGSASGSGRAARGGSWGIDAGSCRSAIRGYGWPDYRDRYCGFRLARTLP